MGKKVRTLDYYGFDEDTTMVKTNEEYENETFEISKAKELRNEKYIRIDE